MNSLRQTVREDLHRYLSPANRTLLKALRVIYREKGLQAILVYRMGRALSERSRMIRFWPVLIPGWIFYAVAVTFVRKGYDITLEPSAIIGPGFFIGHFAGIHLINCSLGKNCSIGQETVIGRAEDVPGPQIGSRVWIGSHSQILGALKIEDGATIGVGAKITMDVPKQALMIGNPARLASRHHDNSKYLGLS